MTETELYGELSWMQKIISIQINGDKYIKQRHRLFGDNMELTLLF